MNGGSAGVPSTFVGRLRVTTVATRIHDRLQEVGLPGRFEELLQAPAPVAGLDLTRPFSDQAPVDTAFWSMIADDAPLGAVVNPALAKQLRQAGVPLRHRAELRIEGDRLGDRPYAEVHIHPFGVVVPATFEVRWARPAPLVEAWSQVADVQGRPATAGVGDAQIATPVAGAAGSIADRVVDLLADAGGGRWQVPDYRIATVIEGTVEPVPDAMPMPAGDIHTALHHLSGGAPPLASPGDAFVPLWSGAAFEWSPGQLAYMLDRGVAVWAAPGAGPGATMGERHRRLALLLAHLTASVGLVQAARASTSVTFPSWADKAAKRLGRLYGPDRPLSGQGLETRRYLTQTGARQVVEELLGKQLHEKYELPPYP